MILRHCALIGSLFLLLCYFNSQPTSIQCLESNGTSTISTLPPAATAEEDSDGQTESTVIDSGTEKSSDDDEYDEEDDDDEDYEEGPVCDGRISTFVKSFRISDYLPDDFWDLFEKANTPDMWDNIHHINDTIDIMIRYENWIEKLKQQDLQKTAVYISSRVMETMIELNISSQCQSDVAAVGAAIHNFEWWAMRFVDANPYEYWNNMRSASFLGSFDDCLAVASPELSDGRRIYGKHCTFSNYGLTPHMSKYRPDWERLFRDSPTMRSLIFQTGKAWNMDNYIPRDVVRYIMQMVQRTDDNFYHYGFCMPHTCTGEDFLKIFHKIDYPLEKFQYQFYDDRCYSVPEAKIREVRLDWHQWFSVYSITAVSVIVLLGTGLHLIGKARRSADSIDSKMANLTESFSKTDSLYRRIIESISAIENTRKLFQNDRNRYPVLDTLRVALLLFIFPINSLGITRMMLPRKLRLFDGMNREEILESNGHWLSRVPGLWFDGLVFLGSVLLAFHQLKRFRSGRPFDYGQYIWAQWRRLSCVMSGVILLIYLVPLVGHGPMWFYVDQYYVAPCRSPASLASSYLFYSNWNEAMDNYTVHSTLPICNPPSWFLSSTFQLFLLAPAVFLPLFLYPKCGLCAVAILVLLSPLITSLPRLLTGYPSYLEATKFIDFTTHARAITHSHWNPLLYVNSGLVGLLTGFLIKCRPRLYLGGPLLETGFWCASLGSVIYALLWHYSFLEQNLIHSVPSVVGWFAYTKMVWPLFLGLTSFLCCTGRLSWIGRVLSLRFLQPVAKLSLPIYLLRSLFIFYRKASAKTIWDMYYFRTYSHILFDFLLTVLAAFVFHLLFEAPWLRLMKLADGPEKSDTADSFQKESKNNDNFKKNGKIATPERKGSSDMNNNGKSHQTNESPPEFPTVADLI